MNPGNRPEEPDAPEVPTTFGLSGAIPNPATEETTLTLDVPTVQAVRVAVYDMLGREVKLIFEGQLAAGAHPFSFSVSALPSGRYVVRAVSNQQTATQFITIVR